MENENFFEFTFTHTQNGDNNNNNNDNDCEWELNEWIFVYKLLCNVRASRKKRKIISNQINDFKWIKKEKKIRFEILMSNE